MIRDVEHLAAELQAKPLLDLPGLAYGGVPVHEAGAAQYVPSHVSECIESLGIECYPILEVTPAGPVQTVDESLRRSHRQTVWVTSEQVSVFVIGVWEVRNGLRRRPSQIARIAPNVPAFVAVISWTFICTRKIVGIVPYQDWISRLPGNDAIDLPALQQLSPRLT